MNIDKIINKYFESSSLPNIEVFDNENIFAVYSDIINILKNSPEIELSILQVLSYCLYEVLDNVLTHSSKNNGTIFLHYHAKESTIKILIADDGIGIQKSLSENELYKNISEKEAIHKCIEDKVTDGKGMGFGLYSTLCLIRNAGIRFEIHSGKHILISDGKSEIVKECEEWQGTIIYIELHSNIEINPNAVLEYRTDIEDSFNENFLDTEELEKLW